MSTIIETTFFLTGALAGRTIQLGSQPYFFENGCMTIQAPAEEIALHARFLERNWQAYPEGHPALKEETDGQRDVQKAAQHYEQQPVHGNVQPNGDGAEARTAADFSNGAVEAEVGDAGSDAAGDGQPQSIMEPVAEVNIKLQKAVLALDPTDASHWTKDGKPAITAVEKLYGSTGITRADVEAAYPGYTQEKAKGAH